MVVGDAVRPAPGVYGEGQTLQALSADHTAEAGRVVGLPTSLQELREQRERWVSGAYALSVHTYQVAD